MLSEIECFAIDFAAKAHAGQLDKNGRCYMAHLFRVAMAVRCDDPYYFMTGILHDAVEDTPVTLDQIGVEFGLDMMLAVESVTRRKDGNSKENYREFVSRASHHPIGKVVKLADVHDNLRPERIGMLPQKDQFRLQDKYAAALEILSPEEPTR